MMQIKSFTFNAFQENSYVLYDHSKEAAIVDPGCSNRAEQNELVQFIEKNGLKPVLLLNTHCHIDHVLGNAFIAKKYGLPLYAHKGEIPVLASCQMVSKMYGIPYEESPLIAHYLEEGNTISFGHTNLQILFTPGHSPASICLFHKESNKLIAGDVLFRASIGRTDLPGGDYDTLIRSIKTQLFPLGDEVTVYPGHMGETTIGYEKKTNPFLRE